MKIRNCEDLIAERLRLESTLTFQKNEIRRELKEIKNLLNPVTNVVKWINRIQNKIQGFTLAKVGTNMGIDFLIRDKILSNSNWLIRSFTPSLLKGLSDLLFNANEQKKKEED